MLMVKIITCPKNLFFTHFFLALICSLKGVNNIKKSYMALLIETGPITNKF